MKKKKNQKTKSNQSTRSCQVWSHHPWQRWESCRTNRFPPRRTMRTSLFPSPLLHPDDEVWSWRVVFVRIGRVKLPEIRMELLRAHWSRSETSNTKKSMQLTWLSFFFCFFLFRFPLSSISFLVHVFLHSLPPSNMTIQFQFHFIDRFQILRRRKPNPSQLPSEKYMEWSKNQIERNPNKNTSREQDPLPVVNDYPGMQQVSWSNSDVHGS